jgi:hypothetical protein
MTISQAYDDILKTLADCIGIPRCNANTQHRVQGDGRLQIASNDGQTVAISATSPKGGYIRWISTPSIASFRGCDASQTSANFAVVIWEQGGDVLDLQSRLYYAVENCELDVLPYNLPDAEITSFVTAYEQIMADEHGRTLLDIPTQAGLAVCKAEISVSFVYSNCSLTPPVCATPAVTPPAPPIPAPVQLFFDNAQITDEALQAILVQHYEAIELRSYFPKLAAIYPFVGGNANAHKYNFLDARDADDAFRLLFLGGWLHTADGVQGNGINAWANTFWNEVANAAANSWNFGFYSRTQTASIQWCDMGNFDGVRASNIFPRVTIVNPDRLYLSHGSAGANFTAGVTTTIRLYQNNRVDTTNVRARVNNTLIIQPTPYIGQNALNYSIGSLNNNLVQQFYSARAYGYAFIANQGFTDAEMIDFENDVTALMTALGRAV